MLFLGLILTLIILSFVNFSFLNPKDSSDPDVNWEEEIKEQLNALEEVKGGSTDDSFTETFPLIAPQYTNSASIIISKLGINAPILHGQDSDSLLKKGFWSFPASDEPGKGEVVLLCHRRYFGKGTPKSCWDINQLRNGDIIEIKLKDGGYTKYKVNDISIIKGNDTSIYNVSNINRLRLISCSTADGDAGSNEYRIIISALPVN